MLLEKERILVAEYGRKLLSAGLTSGTGGNLSVRDPATGLAAVSPSGMEYGGITPADVTVLAPDGGEAVPLTGAEMARARERFGVYGQPKKEERPQ